MILDRKTSVDFILDMVLSLLCVLASIFVIRLDAGSLVSGSKFGETSATEITQLIYLLLTCLMFALVAVRLKTRRGIATLLAGGCLTLMVREMDGFLDHIYHGAWFPLAVGVVFVTVFLTLRHHRTLLDNIGEFIMAPSFGAFLAACLGIFVFSRLFGMKRLWEAVFGVEDLEPVQRGVKNAVEEGCELFGYTLLFISAYGFLRILQRAQSIEKEVADSDKLRRK